MNLKQFLTHPQLSKHCRTIHAGEYLFKQGQLGNTMFVIVEGSVLLLGEGDVEEHVAGLIEAGQFLGEKSILNEASYQRLFSARAKTDTVVMELSCKDMKILEQVAPQIMISIWKRAFEISLKRLEKANYLARILKSSNNGQRLVQLLLYFCRSSGKKVSGGTEVFVTEEGISNYIDMDRAQVKYHLEELIKRKLILSQEGTVYLVPDERRLMEFASTFSPAQAA